ncbi:hypothetical protein [Miltoncostaea oceani]|uniref:hypothetical protein n=1 Tax=Miltoncostaea oceani TaxID=2843216 RepID=UPI001C3E541C|nr:hypothetical protein [Miltoncostaea oceani]
MTTTPAYTPLAVPPSVEALLAEFMTEQLAPELRTIKEKLAPGGHKADLFEVGQRAIALRFQISEWLARAERELDRQMSERYQAIWESSKATATEQGLRTMPAELIKIKAREACGDMAEAVKLLAYHRNDLDSLQSFVQTGVRVMRDEEMGPADGIGAAAGLWRGPA